MEGKKKKGNDIYYTALLSGVGTSNISVSFPDFPGCISHGNSVEEALENGKEALSFHIEGMVEDGEEVPLSSDPNTVQEWIDECEDPVLPALLPVILPDVETQRISVTINSLFLRKIDAFAKSHNMARSQVLVKGGLEYALSH